MKNRSSTNTHFTDSINLQKVDNKAKFKKVNSVVEKLNPSTPLNIKERKLSIQN